MSSTDSTRPTDSPWVTIVWDDPVNLMSYVTYVFQKLFGYSEPHATKLMMQVHERGQGRGLGGQSGIDGGRRVQAACRRSVGDHAAGPLSLDVRKWKRVETAEGTRFRSALDAHETALLQNLVTSLLDMLEERESASPTDELEELTGMRTGHSVPPEDETMKRLLPDFYRSPTEHPAGSGTAESLNSALRSLHEPAIIDAKRQAAQCVLDTLPEGGGKFELAEDDAQAGRPRSTTCDWHSARCSRSGPEGPDHYPPSSDAGHLDVYQWLTALQEYLVLGLMGKPMSGSITDVSGILVGHHERLDQDATLGTGWACGTTVVLAPPGTSARSTSGAGRQGAARPICSTRPTACATSTPSCSPAAAPTGWPPPTA